MGFCRRCGDIVTGERCKCGGTAVAPVLAWRDAENQDKWTRTYVSRDRSASVGGSSLKRCTKAAPSCSSVDLPNKVSAYIAAAAQSSSSNAIPPLKPSKTGPAPEAGILPSPCDNALAKVYGSVLQPKESLATFSCVICNTVFSPDATIYPDPRTADTVENSKFLCRPCFVTNGGSKGVCPTCSRPVLTLRTEGGFIHAAGKYWHKLCFNCDGCHKNVGDVPIVDLLGRPSCSDCFESCLRRNTIYEQESSFMKGLQNSPKYQPTNWRNIGGMDTASVVNGPTMSSKSREASPALEELEQRLGIPRGLREGSPSLEELSHKLSSIGRESSRPRRDSRQSERFRSPEPEDVFSDSPGRSTTLRYSTGSGSPIRRHATDASGSTSPAPTQEAIEEMKLRFMRATSASAAATSVSPLKHHDYPSVSISANASRSPTAFSSRIPVPIAQPQPHLLNSVDLDVGGSNAAGNSIASSSTSSPSTSPSIPMTPDLMSDVSDMTSQSLLFGLELPLYSARRGAETVPLVKFPESMADEFHTRSSKCVQNDDYMERFGMDARETIAEETDSQLTTPAHTPNKKTQVSGKTTLSKIPVARASPHAKETPLVTTTIQPSVINQLKPATRCAKCGGVLFTTKEGGKYITLPAEEGVKSKTYHVECFRCIICEGMFKHAGNSHAIFVKAKGGPCHVECAPPERYTIRKSTSMNGVRSDYAKSSVAVGGDVATIEAKSSTESPLKKNGNKTTLYSSSRYERPLNSSHASSSVPTVPSLPSNNGGFPRFGSRTACPGCNVSVSPMERGVVPGPQGTRWHATCLVCGGKKRKGAEAQGRGVMWMIGRGSGGGREERRRNGEPGCGKRLDSAAKSDGEGGVWCRECLLLLGSSSPVKPLDTGATAKGVLPQNTGMTTIAKQFTGIGAAGDAGKESGILRQLTGGGLTPTRSISPTKQLGGSFWSGASTAGRPRPKSVIGIRSAKSVDEGRERQFSLIWNVLPGLRDKRYEAVVMDASPPFRRITHERLASVISDIPFFSVGLMAFGMFTFLIAMRKVSLLICYLFASSFLIFGAAIFDLSQTLVEVKNREPIQFDSGLGIVRDIGIAISVGLIYCFIWLFVAECPLAELQADLLQQRMQVEHSASWSRWGLPGIMLKWVTLALSLAIPPLHILWHQLNPSQTRNSLYVSDAIIQVFLSTIYVLKLLLNVSLSRRCLRWRVMRDYVAPASALLLSAALGVGNLVALPVSASALAFADSTVGRFLFAIEVYILLLFTLVNAFAKSAALTRREHPQHSQGVGLHTNDVNDEMRKEPGRESGLSWIGPQRSPESFERGELGLSHSISNDQGPDLGVDERFSYTDRVCPEETRALAPDRISDNFTGISAYDPAIRSTQLPHLRNQEGGSGQLSADPTMPSSVYSLTSLCRLLKHPERDITLQAASPGRNEFSFRSLSPSSESYMHASVSQQSLVAFPSIQVEGEMGDSVPLDLASVSELSLSNFPVLPTSATRSPSPQSSSGRRKLRGGELKLRSRWVRANTTPSETMLNPLLIVPDGVVDRHKSGGTQYDVTSFIDDLTTPAYGTPPYRASSSCDADGLGDAPNPEAPSVAQFKDSTLRPLLLGTMVGSTMPYMARASSRAGAATMAARTDGGGRGKRATMQVPAATMSAFPDYYKLLNVSITASQDEIRQAYKRESLKTHPDRFSKVSEEERRRATEMFQAVADAYYVLSDPNRRKEYDNLYNARQSDRTDDPRSSHNFFKQFKFHFKPSTPNEQSGNEHPDPNGVFADVFEELLRPEVERYAPWWSWFGAACGGGLGYIIANVPGMMLGAYAGNRLGAVRDAKGKSVAAVFNELAGAQKAEILRALAIKVLGTAL
ncbi:hypothetical protein AX17_000790 [Amanita inopinata Kibby_2008]|nr:hypothetical protein AX17_000790 [Amanita inopinata Kibby_2008]